LTPGDTSELAPRQTSRRALALFAGHRRAIGVLGLAVLVSALLGLGIPLLTKVVFDHALFPPGGHPRVGLLGLLAAAMIAFGLLGGIASVWQTYLANVVGQEVMRDLRDQLYAHLQGMSLRFFTSTRTGEIQSRISNDIGGVSRAVTDTFAVLLSDTVILITAVVAMAILSWELTLLSLALLPVFGVFLRRVGRMRRELAAEIQRLLAEMSVAAEETLSVSGALLSKISSRGEDAVERYREMSRRLSRLRVREQMVGRTFLGLTITFLTIMPALVYLVAGATIASGAAPHLTAGTVVAFVALQTRLYGPTREILDISLEAQASMALFARVFEYLDVAHDVVDAPDARTVTREQVRGRVALRHVYFSYEARREGERAWTLEDVSLEIEPGQLAALVGPSGAGKTTISYLIPRLYDPAAGAVEIDGRDIRSIRLSSLADVIGMVTQDTYLFHDTLRANLRYAKPGASEEEIERAARAAQVHERILEMPDGYDTVVGERGYRLSGGEKQRVAIARVLLKDPRILILDEATSSLDTLNERLVQAALTPLMHGRTTIAIAHRLSTILSADVIFVMDRGRLVARGTHDELIAGGGLYAELYRHQFGEGSREVAAF